MSNSFPSRFAIGLTLGLLAGLVVVATCNTVWAVISNALVATLWSDRSLMQIALAGAPYFVLAVCGIRARRAWIAALSLTAGFWGYYLWDIIHYTGIGANIGAGILMMFSPLAVTAGALLAWRIGAQANA